MSAAFINNPYALLSDDVDVKTAVLPKKAVVIPAPQPKHTKQFTEKKLSDRSGKSSVGTGRVRGGRATIPFVPRESNNPDFSVGERGDNNSDRPSRPARSNYRSAPRGEGRPANRREHDRRSGTGRRDGEKKEVAGASWGCAIDLEVVAAGHTADNNALAVTAGSGDGNVEEMDNAADMVTVDISAAVERGQVAVEDDKTRSYADYEKEISDTKAALKAKPTRRANEGLDSSFYKGEVLTKKDMNEEAGSLAMLLAGCKPKKKFERKQPKDRQVMTDLLKFQFAGQQQSSYRRSDRPERSGNSRSARNQNVSAIKSH